MGTPSCSWQLRYDKLNIAFRAERGNDELAHDRMEEYAFMVKMPQYALLTVRTRLRSICTGRALLGLTTEASVSMCHSRSPRPLRSQSRAHAAATGRRTASAALRVRHRAPATACYRFGCCPPASCPRR